MKYIQLEPIPNQSFSITLDGLRYDFFVKYANGIMVFDIARDDIQIIQGQRAVSGFPILPYRHLQNGNFVFITESEEIPDYTKFGNTQFLIYASAEELLAL